MSQENAEMVRRAFDAYNRPEGFRQFIAWLRDEFDHARLDVNDAWAIRDARPVHGQAFTGRAEALRAAGLSE